MALRVGRWLWRGLAVLGVLILALAGLGAIYQATSEAGDRQAFPPIGELVDIGGRRLHLVCMGEGTPTVILEAGLGGTSTDWAWIQPEAAKATRTCAYDRAGMGWSDSGPAPRDAAAIVGDLNKLLAATVEGPVVLAGHSYGGLYALAYAAAHPAEIGGVVLIDASHPNQWAGTPAARDQFETLQWVYRVSGVASRVGLMRLIDYSPMDSELPTEQARRRWAMGNMVAFIDTAAAEFAATPLTAASARAAAPLGDTPLFVLSAGDHRETAALFDWAGLQADLATRSNNNMHRTVEAATHMSVVIDERDAQTSIAAILAVVDAVRTGGRLAE